MDPELKRLLRENLELSKENNKILHKMHRGLVLGRIMRIIYWVVILGVAMGSYYFIQPYIDSLLAVYGGISGGVSDLQNIGTLFGR